MTLIWQSSSHLATLPRTRLEDNLGGLGSGNFDTQELRGIACVLTVATLRVALDGTDSQQMNTGIGAAGRSSRGSRFHQGHSNPIGFESATAVPAHDLEIGAETTTQSRHPARSRPRTITIPCSCCWRVNVVLQSTYGDSVRCRHERGSTGTHWNDRASRRNGPRTHCLRMGDTWDDGKRTKQRRAPTSTYRPPNSDERVWR